MLIIWYNYSLDKILIPKQFFSAKLKELNFDSYWKILFINLLHCIMYACFSTYANLQQTSSIRNLTSGQIFFQKGFVWLVWGNSFLLFRTLYTGCFSTTDIFDLLKFLWEMRKIGLKNPGNWTAWRDILYTGWKKWLQSELMGQIALLLKRKKSGLTWDMENFEMSFRFTKHSDYSYCSTCYWWRA